MDTEKQKARKAFKNLSDELQETIASMKTVNDIRTPGKNAGLSLVQLDKVEIASLYVLLGLEKAENLAEKIKSFDVDAAIAQKVAAEIDKTVFWPVRDLLTIAQAANKNLVAKENPSNSTFGEKTIGSVLFARNNK